MDLRPYQSGAIDGLRQGFREGARRQVLVAPPGAGKTVLASAMIQGALERGNPSLFLANRRELITQCASKLRAFGLEPGIIMAGFPEHRERMIQVGSIESIRRRPWLPDAKLVFVDECHLRGSEFLLELLPDSYLVGLTATPCRKTGRGLGEDFDHMVVAASFSQLIEEGFLLEPRTFAPTIPDTSGLPVRGGDFRVSDVDDVMNRRSVIGDVVATWLRLASCRRSVFFGTTVAHSKRTCRAFLDAGVPAAHIDGTTPYDTRRALLAKLVSGEILVLCNCEVFTYGWDCPEVEVAIIARPTASLALHIQVGGRVFRPCPGKERPLILDHAGNTLQHGWVTADRDWNLEQRATRRKKSNAGGAPAIRQCPECYALMPPSLASCSECGHVFVVEAPEVKVAGGDLLELTQDSYDAMIASLNRAEAQRIVFYRRMWLIALDRKYKPGWARMAFRREFGHYPTTEVVRAATAKVS